MPPRTLLSLAPRTTVLDTEINQSWPRVGDHFQISKNLTDSICHLTPASLAGRSSHSRTKDSKGSNDSKFEIQLTDISLHSNRSSSSWVCSGWVRVPNRLRGSRKTKAFPCRLDNRFSRSFSPMMFPREIRSFVFVRNYKFGTGSRVKRDQRTTKAD